MRSSFFPFRFGSTCKTTTILLAHIFSLLIQVGEEPLSAEDEDAFTQLSPKQLVSQGGVGRQGKAWK